MKRIVSAILLVILLTSMLYSAFKIMAAEAVETVYIRADGSIYPPDAPVERDGDFYWLTNDLIVGNISSEKDGIVIERSNIVFDGYYCTIRNFLSGASGSGIFLYGVDNVTIRNTNVRSFSMGIWLTDSADDNLVIGNNVTDTMTGIGVIRSTGNKISDNNSTDNIDHGIALQESPNNTISNNICARNNFGIGLRGSCSDNVIFGNNLADNGVGMIIEASSDNRIYNNNFIDSWGGLGQVFNMTSGDTNSWNEEYPIFGNYWSDYNGTDSDGDGIGDTPYVIDDNNKDYYPLMNPYSTQIQGDINRDKTVDIFDCVIVALAFSSTPSDPNWNPVADINNDGIVDIFDLVVVALHFGETS